MGPGYVPYELRRGSGARVELRDENSWLSNFHRTSVTNYHHLLCISCYVFQDLLRKLAVVAVLLRKLELKGLRKGR